MDDLKELINKIIEFRDNRNWKQFHTPENLAKSISIEANELLENYQWGPQNANMENIKDEIADVFVYVLLFAKELDIDIVQTASDKMDKNNKKYPVEKAYGSSKKYTEFGK